MVAPVRADGGGSVSATTAVLPAPLPAMPAMPQAVTVASLPAVVLPSRPALNLPSIANTVNGINADLDAAITARRVELNTEFARLNRQLARARVTTNKLRARIGSPLEVSVNSGSQSYTSAYQMASEMSGAMQTSIAYLRGLSRIGTTGLDLTFVFLGLGWLIVLQLIDMWVHIICLMFKPLLWVIDQFRKTVDLILGLLPLVGFFI